MLKIRGMSIINHNLDLESIDVLVQYLSYPLKQKLYEICYHDETFEVESESRTIESESRYLALEWYPDKMHLKLDHADGVAIVDEASSLTRA